MYTRPIMRSEVATLQNHVTELEQFRGQWESRAKQWEGYASQRDQYVSQLQQSHDAQVAQLSSELEQRIKELEASKPVIEFPFEASNISDFDDDYLETDAADGSVVGFLEEKERANKALENQVHMGEVVKSENKTEREKAIARATAAKKLAYEIGLTKDGNPPSKELVDVFDLTEFKEKTQSSKKYQARQMAKDNKSPEEIAKELGVSEWTVKYKYLKD
jgi:hypothetical protein